MTKPKKYDLSQISSAYLFPLYCSKHALRSPFAHHLFPSPSLILFSFCPSRSHSIYYAGFVYIGNTVTT